MLNPRLRVAAMIVRMLTENLPFFIAKLVGEVRGQGLEVSENFIIDAHGA
jgi:hypothetical protein